MSDTSASRKDGVIDQLLAEAGLDDDAALWPALLELRMLGQQQPQASAQVQALMAPVLPATTMIPATPIVPVTTMLPAAPEACTDELAARRRMKRRLTLTTFSVAVSLAAGGAVAAASDQGMRDTVTSFVSNFTGGTGGDTADRPAQQHSGTGEFPAVPTPAVSQPAPETTGSGSQQPDVQGTPGITPPVLPGAARVPGISVSGRAIAGITVPGPGAGQDPLPVPVIPTAIPTPAVTVPAIPDHLPHPGP